MTIVLGETWGDQLRAYEREKRYEVDAGLVSGQPLRLLPGMFQAGEARTESGLARVGRDKGRACRRVQTLVNICEHVADIEPHYL